MSFSWTMPVGSPSTVRWCSSDLRLREGLSQRKQVSPLSHDNCRLTVTLSKEVSRNVSRVVSPPRNGFKSLSLSLSLCLSVSLSLCLSVSLSLSLSISLSRALSLSLSLCLSSLLSPLSSLLSPLSSLSLYIYIYISLSRSLSPFLLIALGWGNSHLGGQLTGRNWQIAISAISLCKAQIARTFRRKSAIFTRNSQIASNRNSRP